MKKVILSIASVFCFAAVTMAADPVLNPIITAMPSLSIAPDARAAGMGDVGVATTADLNSLYWNAAKFAYMDSHGGITANYTPWLRKLVGEIDLAHLEGYYKWDDVQGIAGSFTYFSMGAVQLTDMSGTVLQEAHPNEWALDVSYYRKLHEYVSMAVALRFMYSDLNNGINSSVSNSAQEMHAAWTMSADVDLYYRQPIDIKMGTSYFALGFTLTNLGGKMTYDDVTKNFIPATMRIGASYELPFDNYNKLTFNLQCDKLLVPTRLSKYAENYDPDDPATWRMTQDEYSDMTSVSGIFKSFADAPGGAKEEFNEVRWGAGLEYTYNRQFFARAGYSHENKYKGNRQYITVGAGFHLSIFSLDFAYCIGLAASNPLDQTMRFTLGFDLAGIKDLVNNRKEQ